MKTKRLKLEYLERYNAFGIADEVIDALSAQKITPLLSLKEEDYIRLGSHLPSKNAPKVAFLLGREAGYYTIDFNYAKAVAESGVKISFLTYRENISAMAGCDGLILPGGSFDSPKEFYNNSSQIKENKVGARAYAYITSIMEAEKQHMPILGICAGSQIIAGMHSLRIYKDLKEHTTLEHKTKELEAHNIIINQDSPLYDIIKKRTLTVNSRHVEGLFPNDTISDLKIYAHAEDGTPEAWGSKEKNILCIQWHPEDFAAAGDKTMQGIYNWLASKARIFQKQKQIKSQKLNIRPLLPARTRI